MKKEYSTLINNTKLFAIGNIVSKLAQYIVLAICTYMLTTAEYGISDTLVQTCALLVPILSADIAEGLFRFSMDKNYSREQVFSNSMLINVAGTIVALVALPIEYFFFSDIRTVMFITILTILEFYQVSIKEFVRGLGLTKIYTISGFINAIIQIEGCLLLIYVLDLGIIGYLLTIAVSFIIEILFCLWKVKIRDYFHISALSKPVVYDLLKYSFPLAPNKIMWWIISASDRYFVLWIISASAAGLYSAAAKFPALITIVVGFFFQAWQISAIEMSDTKEKDEFFSNIFNLLWSTIGVFTAFVITVIRFIIKLLVAEAFYESWEYAPFLLVAASFGAIQSFLGVNYTISKDSFGALKTTSIAAVCNLGLNYVLITRMGIQGATIATLASFIIVSVYRFFDTRKYVKITIDNKIGILLTYSMLIIESIVIYIYPDLYFVSIPGFIIILIANYSKCKLAIGHLVSYINGKRLGMSNND